MEHLIYPLKTMNITQGTNGEYSHKGTNAVDDSGKDRGIDPLFAPCTMQLKARDTEVNGNAVWFESMEPVLFADGTINYATFLFIHDDYIGDYAPAKIGILPNGRIFKQGEEFGDEGTMGKATGNHAHMEVAKGRFTKQYVHNINWQLPNSILPWDAFFVNGTKIINGNGYNWKSYTNDGWLLEKGCWYFYENGQSVKGWKWIEKIDEFSQGWYYFNPSNGIMQKNMYIQHPKGKCWVDKYGVWDNKYV